jgi:N-methylhydantoinase A
LVAFGGAGPLHAVDIARELGAKQVVIPSSPGLLSAYGCLTADLVVDSLAPARFEVTGLDRDALGDLVTDRIRAVQRMLERHTAAPETRIFYECQFQHQSHLIEIEGSHGMTGEQIGALFLSKYAESYGPLAPEAEILVRRVRVEGRCQRDAIDEARLTEVASIARTGYVERSKGTHWRPDLERDAVIKGPATITATDASIYVPPDAVARVVEYGHIVIDP